MLRVRHHLFGPVAAGLLTLVALAGCANSGAIPGLDSPASGTSGAGNSGSGTSGSAGASSSGSGSASASSGGDPSATVAPAVTVGVTGGVLVDAVIRGAAEANTGATGQYDFTPMFAPVKGYLRGSGAAICHLDSALSPDNLDLSIAGSTTYNAPHQVATALTWAGFTMCDTASEHALDLGMDGLAKTVTVFSREGLGYAGPGTTQSTGHRVALTTVGDATVADLAYTYSLDGTTTNGAAPSTARWLRRSLYPAVKAEGIIADAEAARKAGADYVVVSMHWGEESAANPTQEQTDLAKALLTNAAVDLVIGTHPTAIQPCQRINGKYVFYSLGNLLAPPTATTPTPAGLLARVSLARQPGGGLATTAAVLPTRVDPTGFVVRPVTAQDDGQAAQQVMDTLGLFKDCPVTPLS